MQTYDHIKLRLEQYLANQLGNKPEELRQDVRYLCNRFAWELAILYQKLSESRDYIQHQVQQSLLPEIHSRALPAHALAYGTPRGEETVLNPQQHQFILHNPAFRDDRPKAYYFTPLRRTGLLKAGLRFIVGARGLEEVLEQGVRRLKMALPAGAEPSHPGVLWLGIKLDEAVPIDRGMCIHMDYNRHSAIREDAIEKLLPLCSWSIDGNELPVETGWQTGRQTEDEPVDFPDHEFLRLHALEKEILNHYDRQFVTIGRGYSFPRHSACPPPIQALDPEERARICPEPLLWIRLVFPAGATAAMADSARLQLNCFPIINRKINKSADVTPLEKRIIQPLNGHENFRAGNQSQVDHFLGIQRIFSKAHHYRPQVFGAFAAAPPGHYALQSGRVEARDIRDLWFRLTELLDKMKSGIAYMKPAAGKQWLATLHTLEEQAAKLEEIMAEQDQPFGETGAYLHIHVLEPNRPIHVRYWQTQGAVANSCGQPGDVLKSEENGLMENDRLRLLTLPKGGRAPLSEAEWSTLAQSLLSRSCYHHQLIQS